MPKAAQAFEAKDPPQPVPASIVLTKLMCFRRELVAPFFAAAAIIDDIQWKHNVKPFWNGEDIVFALSAVRFNNGKLNQAHTYLARDIIKITLTNLNSISASYSSIDNVDQRYIDRAEKHRTFLSTDETIKHLAFRAMLIDETFRRLGLVVPDPKHDTEPIEVRPGVGPVGSRPSSAR